MCTSFIYKGKDTLIAMNFDNNGMKYSIDTGRKGWFTVMVDGGRGKVPSFGVSSDGLFFNNLVVDSNGKGLYRRPSKKVTYTTKLITDLLTGAIETEDLAEYLSHVEVVNTPDLSCHCMICDPHGNTWVVEPGRGNLYSAYTDSKYYAMTNFSLWDTEHEHKNVECTRYETVTKRLKSTDDLEINEAFEILDSAAQLSGEWITELSMVFSKNNQAVYYRLNRGASEICKILLTT